MWELGSQAPGWPPPKGWAELGLAAVDESAFLHPPLPRVEPFFPEEQNSPVMSHHWAGLPGTGDTH